MTSTTSIANTADGRRAVSLLSLPEEIIEKIVRTVESQESNLRYNMSNLCRTSKLLDRISRPILYEDIDLPALRDLYTFTRCLTYQPDLVKFVRTLTLNYWCNRYRTGVDFEWLKDNLVKEGHHEFYDLLNDDEEGHKTDNVLYMTWFALTESLLLKLSRLENLYLRTGHTEDLTNLVPDIQNSREVEGPKFAKILPCLRKLSIVSKDALTVWEAFAHLPISTLKLIDCGFRARRRQGNHTESITYDSVRKLCLFNSYDKTKELQHKLIAACPHLEEFKYFMPDDDEEEEDPDDITPYELVHYFHPHVKNTLHTLSLTTESLGDDNGFPSLREFTSLKYLHLDVFELADYDEEDTEDEDSDSDSSSSSEEISTVDEALADADNPDWEDVDSDSASDAETIDTDSSCGDGKCKPFLHLLPRSLETLWLDNLYTLGGDLDDELIKLARSTKDDFVNFRRITIEGAEETESADMLQRVFEGAGIEFMRMPLHHFWYVEDGYEATIPDRD